VTVTVALQLTLFGLVWGALYALTAHGLNLIYGVMKILNIAHGEFLMLGAYLTYWLLTLGGVSPAVSLLVVAPAMFALGGLVYLVVVQPLVRASGGSIVRLEQSTLIMFFGVLMVIQNTALVLWTADYRVIEYLTTPVGWGEVRIAANRLVVLAAALVISGLLHGFLRHTLAGKAIRAISQDREASLLLAIDARRVALVAFALGAALAGCSGALVSMIYVITPTMGILFTVKAFTVMVVGGFGRILGALAAGLLLGVTEAWGSFLLGEGYREAIGYAVLALLILMSSHGWLGGRERLAA
jgi:branched-chain amino acid transport system permease protein